MYTDQIAIGVSQIHNTLLHMMQNVCCTSITSSCNAKLKYLLYVPVPVCIRRDTTVFTISSTVSTSRIKVE